MSPERRERPRHSGRALAASAGIVIGRVQRLTRGRQPIPERKLTDEAPEREAARLDRAVAAALEELRAERAHLAEAGARDPELILEAHMMMLNDPELIGRARDRILTERINAEWALRRQMDEVGAVFDSIEDDYLRERREDVEQVGARVLRHLLGDARGDEAPPAIHRCIALGEAFTVSDVIRLWRMGVAGIIAEQGGRGSHALILARGVGLPALFGAKGALAAAKDGDIMILDGERGVWVLNPDWHEQRGCLRFAEAIAICQERLMAHARRPSVSADGRAMALMANIEFPEEVLLARRVGADGVGLYRTEFLFMNHRGIPDEEEQRQQYERVIAGMRGKPVIIRLLDIGADKPAIYRRIAGESGGGNPALGLRGVRLLLRQPELLRAQLRAIIRAANDDTRVLAPMIADAEEMRAVREMLEGEARALGRPAPELGAMIEVPAAALTADAIARVSDFLSIGTNDLMQYTLAADRADDEVAALYRADHPAILTLMRNAVRAARQARISISVCGEIAADTAWTQRLLNMGFDALSMGLHAVLTVRRHLSRLEYEPES